MQFDFNVGPNQSQHIDVAGTFVKYKGGSGMIRVRLNGGGFIDLLPGQGVNNVNFVSVDVQDRTGAQNVGTILAGMYDFRDDRITGTVDVVDGGKARTNSDSAGIAYGYTGPSASTAAHVQLLNPTASAKNIYVEQIAFFSTGTVANGIAVRRLDTPLANLYGNGARKRVNASAASVAEVRTLNNATVLGTGNYMMALDKSLKLFRFTEPLQLPPGVGLILVNATSGEDLGATFEYFEETV